VSIRGQNSSSSIFNLQSKTQNLFTPLHPKARLDGWIARWRNSKTALNPLHENPCQFVDKTLPLQSSIQNPESKIQNLFTPLHPKARLDVGSAKRKQQTALISFRENSCQFVDKTLPLQSSIQNPKLKISSPLFIQKQGWIARWRNSKTALNPLRENPCQFVDKTLPLQSSIFNPKSRIQNSKSLHPSSSKSKAGWLDSEMAK